MQSSLKKNDGSLIRHVLTADGRVGYDQFGQLRLATPDGDATVYTFINDLRDATCQICVRGWEPTGASLGDQAHSGVLGAWVHRSCLTRVEAFVDRVDFRRALAAAGVRHHGLEPLPNGYWSAGSPWARPWYNVPLRVRPAALMLGWRKHVVEVCIAPNAGHWLVPGAFELAFKDEKVTKKFEPDAAYVHAWSLEHLASYLRLIDGVLGADGLVAPEGAGA